VLAADPKFCLTDRAFSGVNMINKSKEEVVQEFRIQSIQEATLRVISRKGMAAATMQEIAEEAGVAKGTIYLYFRDRDELVEKTFDAAMAQLMVEIDRALEKDTPFEQKIRDVMSAKLAFLSGNREFVRLYLTAKMPESIPERQRQKKKNCHPQYRARVERFAGVLRLAMERGEIRTMDAERLAMFIIEGSTAIILERLMEESSPPGESDVDLIVGLILDGVRKRS
jgi:TetR/AcrR family fatty acid metabolism transcriptional regulator